MKGSRLSAIGGKAKIASERKLPKLDLLKEKWKKQSDLKVLEDKPKKVKPLTKKELKAIALEEKKFFKINQEKLLEKCIQKLQSKGILEKPKILTFNDVIELRKAKRIKSKI